MKLLKKLRLQQGFSLRALASSVGKSPAFLSEIERGTRKPSQETLVALAQVLGHQEELFLSADLVAPDVKKALADTKVYRFVSKLATLPKTEREAFLQIAHKLL